VFCADPVQLKVEQTGGQLLGSPVLDKTRNLVVGLISTQYDPLGKIEKLRDYAVNLRVLKDAPFFLPVQDTQIPKRRVSRPQPIQSILPEADLGIAWNNAPAPSRFCRKLTWELLGITLLLLLQHGLGVMPLLRIFATIGALPGDR
jgi:hypothetical protein